MREIKFRGKRIDTGDWVHGHYFETPLTDENSGTSPEAGWYFLSGETRHCISKDGVVYVVDPETVGQFTGRYDTENECLYDGDILEDFISNKRYVIEWDDYGLFLFHPINDQGRQNGIDYYELEDEISHSATIRVGNIYDNPELLKIK